MEASACRLHLLQQLLVLPLQILRVLCIALARTLSGLRCGERRKRPSPAMGACSCREQSLHVLMCCIVLAQLMHDALAPCMASLRELRSVMHDDCMLTPCLFIHSTCLRNRAHKHLAS